MEAAVSTCWQLKSVDSRRRQNQHLASPLVEHYMKIHLGYELIYESEQPTPMVLMLTAQPGATQRLLIKDEIHIEPAVPVDLYQDAYGNLCTRLEAPAGLLRITTDALLDR